VIQWVAISLLVKTSIKKTHMGMAVGKSHFIFVGILKWG
jgi:hypothetical protein